jgi:hypothetical protein
MLGFGSNNNHNREEMQMMMFQKRVDRDIEGARGLGWASIGIGLTELTAPQKVEDMLGIEDRPDQRGILYVLGVRELMHGLCILTERAPTRGLSAGVWSRVAGDVLDSALLAMAATKTKRPGSFAAVTAAVMGIGLLDMMYAKRVSQDRSRGYEYAQAR